jgi:hypothetical protein
MYHRNPILITRVKLLQRKGLKLIDELQEAMTPEDIARGDTITSDLP